MNKDKSLKHPRTSSQCSTSFEHRKVDTCVPILWEQTSSFGLLRRVGRAISFKYLAYSSAEAVSTRWTPQSAVCVLPLTLPNVGSYGVPARQVLWYRSGDFFPLIFAIYTTLPFSRFHFRLYSKCSSTSSFKALSTVLEPKPSTTRLFSSDRWESLQPACSVQYYSACS